MAGRKFNFNGVNKVLVGNEPIEENKIEDTAVESNVASAVTNLAIKIDKQPMVKKAFDVRFVPRSKMVFHSKNDYPMEAVEKLAESILEYGLIHNIEVYYEEDTDTYLIEVGEQRTRAIDLLIERYENTEETDTQEYKNYLDNVKQFAIEGYPCNVKRKREHEDLSEEENVLLAEIDSECRLIIANEIQRDRDVVRTSKHIQRLNELYNKRNALLDKNEKINVNVTIGKQLGITERQVKNYKKIEKLIPELQELFEKKGITLKEGTCYASLKEAEQRQILELINDGGNKEEIKQLSAKLMLLQKEINEKEKNIRSLESEKENALKQIDEQKNAAALLEEKIKAEMVGLNDEEVKKLEKELKQALDNKKETEHKLQQMEKEKSKKIQELEEKLQEQTNQKKMSNESMAGVKAALQMENNMKTIETCLSSWEKAMQEYMKNYNPEYMEKTPESFVEELQELLSQI